MPDTQLLQALRKWTKMSVIVLTVQCDPNHTFGGQSRIVSAVDE